jgi:origin recognition complex subunit 4
LNFSVFFVFKQLNSNVHHLLEQTVTAGEGNSMLVVGARGSGKTTLVENALDDLRAAHSGEFHVVRLNGLLQTDDKQALREIWRQLGVEMELDENEQPKQTNFADTLQSILAVLSHPDELQQPEEEGGGQQDYQDGDGVEKTAMAVVFILDEFDQFAIHPRQTLLYNLFDIAQAKKAPIAVIGLTCRVNIVDRLEKRVKSRFSHRTVHLKLPSTLEEFWAVVRQGLIVDPLDPTTTTANGTTEEYFSEWNSYIDTILRPSPQFTNLLTSTYTISKTPVPIFNALLIPFSNITPSDPFPASESLENSTPSFKAPHPTLSLLPSLSDLQLSLLIAAARLEVLADTDAVTFEMVYDEYLKLVSKVRVNGTPGGGAAGGVGRVWGAFVGGRGMGGYGGVCTHY